MPKGATLLMKHTDETVKPKVTEGLRGLAEKEGELFQKLTLVEEKLESKKDRSGNIAKS